MRKYVADSRVLELVEAFLKAEIMDGMEHWTPISGGTANGEVLSPLLSNLYLDDLDHLMAGKGFEMTHYADDMVIQCRTRAEAERALAMVQSWTASRGLTLHPTKTKVVDVRTDGFEFLGYRFIRHCRFPRKKSLAKFKDAIRGKTRRTSGRSMKAVITDVNRTLLGWFEYFKHSHWVVFDRLDKWVRMRLRVSTPPSKSTRSWSKSGSPSLAE